MRNFTSKQNLRKGISRSLIALFSLICCVIFSTNVMANVVVTAATGGTGISADKASTGLTPGYTSLSIIKIAESTTNDFKRVQTDTIRLSAPGNYNFRAGVGTVTQVGTGFQNTATINVTSTTITVIFSTNQTN